MKWMLLALALHFPAVAASQEGYTEVVSFDATYEVRPVGTIRVTEEITLRRAEAGFGRAFPRILVTSYRRPGTLVPVQIPLRVLDVRLNGDPVGYNVRTHGGDLGWDGVRVQMGLGSPLLQPGEHRFTLIYETDRWATYGPVSDWITRNVTGKGWTLPIARVTARVRISDLEAPLSMSAFLEGRGTEQIPGETSWDPAGEALFRAPRALQPGESFAIQMELPKWVLDAVQFNRERQWFWMDWGGWIQALIATLLVVGMYIVMWWRVGVDRSGEPLVVEYEPPSGYSPAQVGFLRDRGYASRHFAAAVVSMAVKGAVRIRKDGSRWILERMGEGRSLTSDERAAHRTLFDGVETVPLDLSSNSRLGQAAHVLRENLAGRLERAFFVANERWFLAGLALSIVGYTVLAWRWRFDIPAGGWLLGPFLSFWTVLTGSMLLRAVHYVRHGRASGGNVSIALGGVGLLVSAPLVLAEVVLLLIFLEVVPEHLVAASWIMGATNVAFYHLLQRPTATGKPVLNRVEGFYRYLSAVESDRLARTLSRGEALHDFESCLPYAIALGVERRWSRSFSHALTPPGGGVTAEYQPDWYASDEGPGGPDADLGEALSSCLAAGTPRN